MFVRALIAAAALVAPIAATAHHSFAVFFDPTKDISITGKVTAFRFTNPHGLVVLDVTDAQGRVRTRIAVGDDGTPTVALFDETGQTAPSPAPALTRRGRPR